MSRTASVNPRHCSPLARLVSRLTRRRKDRARLPSPIAVLTAGVAAPRSIVSRVALGQPGLDPEVLLLATQLVAGGNGASRSPAAGRGPAGTGERPAGKLLAVADFADDPRFLPDERAALAFAAAAADPVGGVPVGLLAELRRHFFDRDIVELSLAVAAANRYNRFDPSPAGRANVDHPAPPPPARRPPRPRDPPGGRPMQSAQPLVDHRPLLFAIANRMLGSVADAEDVLQDAFLRWHRAQAAGTTVESPKAWLSAVVSRLCLDQLRSARVQVGPSPLPPDAAPSAPPRPPGADTTG